VDLSEDHQIDTNDFERQRLLSEHPNEPDVISRNRYQHHAKLTAMHGAVFRFLYILSLCVLYQREGSTAAHKRAWGWNL